MKTQNPKEMTVDRVECEKFHTLKFKTSDDRYLNENPYKAVSVNYDRSFMKLCIVKQTGNNGTYINKNQNIRIRTELTRYWQIHFLTVTP